MGHCRSGWVWAVLLLAFIGALAILISSSQGADGLWISIDQPGDGHLIQGSYLYVQGTAGESLELSQVEVSTDNMSWQGCSGTESWDASIWAPDGNVTIYARAANHSLYYAYCSINVTVDSVQPELWIENPLDYSFTNEWGGIEVNGTAWDQNGIMQVEVTIDNVNWYSSGAEDWSCWIGLDEGFNTITVRATDNVGLSQEQSIYVIRDTVPPDLWVDFPSDGYMSEEPGIEVNGGASDANGIQEVEYEVNGGGFQPAGGGSWSFWVDLQDGNNNIHVRATDMAGNQNETWLSIEYFSHDGDGGDGEGGDGDGGDDGDDDKKEGFGMDMSLEDSGCGAFFMVWFVAVLAICLALIVAGATRLPYSWITFLLRRKD